MAAGSPSDVARVVVDLAASRPASLGTGRLVCVDGPAGSGKTTLAAAVAGLTGAEVIHTDDLMAGWRGIDAVGRQLGAVVGSLARGRAASYRCFDWHLDRYDRTVPVAPADWLVVEGVGSGAVAVAAHVTVLAWVEAGDDLRLERGRVRDGEAMQEQWRRFMVDEQALFARERTRERADVLVDGTGRRAPVVR